MPIAAAHHHPVLLEECLKWLQPGPGHRVLDATVGAGGHARASLQCDKRIELLGIDRDESALEVAAETLAPFEGRVTLRHGELARMIEPLADIGWDSLDLVIMDIGLSSMQIDDPARGFSYRQDGPLDMRMDRQCETTAADILNTWSEDELTTIFRDFGEISAPHRFARAVVDRRADAPWQGTAALAELAREVLGRQRSRSTPIAARCFQALRIAVNDELGQLEAGLDQALNLLRPGRRIVVIAFHSLEDRRVKVRFKRDATGCICPPELPECRCDHVASLKILTRRPVRADAAETARNPRAASARLRAAEKL